MAGRNRALAAPKRAYRVSFKPSWPVGASDRHGHVAPGSAPAPQRVGSRRPRASAPARRVRTANECASAVQEARSELLLWLLRRLADLVLAELPDIALRYSRICRLHLSDAILHHRLHVRAVATSALVGTRVRALLLWSGAWCGLCSCRRRRCLRKCSARGNECSQSQCCSSHWVPPCQRSRGIAGSAITAED